jgi:transcriptional antiterminator RfaH
MPLSRSINWFCIQTKPLKEVSAVRYCREQLGVEAYFPKLRRQKRIRRVRREVISPLFPRYFFCRFDPAMHYRAVRYAPDVIDLVSFGGKPALVSDTMIAELRGWAGEALDLITIQPGLQPGDAVQISDGPMRGLHAVILHETSDPDRVAVLLSILSCGAKLVIDRSQLERVA